MLPLMLLLQQPHTPSPFICSYRHLKLASFSWDISLSNQRLNGLSSSFHPLNFHTFSRNNFCSMTKSTKCLHSSSHPFRTCSLFNTFRYMHFAECSKYFEMNSSCEWQKGLNLLSISNDNAVTSTCASDKWLSFFLCGEIAYKSHRVSQWECKLEWN